MWIHGIQPPTDQNVAVDPIQDQPYGADDMSGDQRFHGFPQPWHGKRSMAVCGGGAAMPVRPSMTLREPCCMSARVGFIHGTSHSAALETLAISARDTLPEKNRLLTPLRPATRVP